MVWVGSSAWPIHKAAVEAPREGKRVTQPAALPGRRLQRDRRLTRQRAGDQIIDGARRGSQHEDAEEITGLREVESHR